MKALGVAVVVLLLVTACGGDDKGSRVLHFTGRDETESSFRTRIRGVFGDNPIGISLLCTQIRGLSSKDAAALLAKDPNEPEDNEIPKGTTPKPGQKGEPKDLERAAVIFQEECSRMFPK